MCMTTKRITYVINLISGPSSGKSLISSLLFAKLKLRGFIVEYVQEYAKHLVWTKNYELLNNQYYVTQTQYNLLKQMIGEVDFIVTDGPLVNGLYYNKHNKDNICNIEKTENYILDCHRHFNSINIFLERGDYKYEQQGRIQNEDESKEIDIIIKHMIKQNNIDFTMFKSDTSEENLNTIIDLVIETARPIKN